MSKSLSRLLCLLSLLGALIGGLLLLNGYEHGTTLANSTVVSVYFPAMMIGLVLLSVAGLLVLIAWLGALVEMAGLGSWGWFAFLLLFSGMTLLIYIFCGPAFPSSPPQPAVAPPYNGFGD